MDVSKMISETARKQIIDFMLKAKLTREQDEELTSILATVATDGAVWGAKELGERLRAGAHRQ